MSALSRIYDLGNSAMRTVAFAFHGIHSREARCFAEKKLLRNSLPEKIFIDQLKALKSSFRSQRINDPTPTLIHDRMFRRSLKIALTFDDGYRNNLRAAELVADIFGFAPMTVFLTTSLIGHKLTSNWLVNIGLLVLLGRFELDQLDFQDSTYRLATESERVASFDDIRRQFKQMDAETRQYNYATILEQANAGELERLLDGFPEFVSLNLDEIKQMQSIGVRFQPHGHSHEILHAKQSRETILQEIVTSKEFIERELNEKCLYFAYPNGNYCDTAISVLKDNGFVGAFTTDPGFADSLKGNFVIPRLTPNRKLDKFKRQLRGQLN